jgi:hypothetical protein
VYGVWCAQFRKSLAKSKKREHEADLELLEGKAEGISDAGEIVPRIHEMFQNKLWKIS